jgi:hypothetical protein
MGVPEADFSKADPMLSWCRHWESGESEPAEKNEPAEGAQERELEETAAA